MCSRNETSKSRNEAAMAISIESDLPFPLGQIPTTKLEAQHIPAWHEVHGTDWLTLYMVITLSQLIELMR